MASAAARCLLLVAFSGLQLGRCERKEANPPKCATDMSAIIEDIATAAEDIVFSTEDCVPPGLSELDCAADIIDAVEQFSGVAAKISSSTLTCGGINNACAVEVASTVEDTADSSEYLVAAASTCASDPFTCVVDITEAINAIMSVAVDIDNAITVCNPAPPPIVKADPSDEQTYNAALQSLGLTTEQVKAMQDSASASGAVERRLQKEMREEVKTLGYNTNSSRLEELKKAGHQHDDVLAQAAMERAARREAEKARRPERRARREAILLAMFSNSTAKAMANATANVSADAGALLV